jgi:hypothetical protein
MSRSSACSPHPQASRTGTELCSEGCLIPLGGPTFRRQTSLPVPATAFAAGPVEGRLREPRHVPSAFRIQFLADPVMAGPIADAGRRARRSHLLEVVVPTAHRPLVAWRAVGAWMRGWVPEERDGLSGARSLDAWSGEGSGVSTGTDEHRTLARRFTRVDA